MSMNISQKGKGFTIIEVVLVLAIAGLIFMMVFIALPALQRNQRDTARKSDVGAVASAVSTYSGNNRGKFPTGPLIQDYVEEHSENTVTIVVTNITVAVPDSIAPADGVIAITQKTTCGDSESDKQNLSAGTTRQYTVVTKLESGNGAYFCQGS